MLAHVGGVPVEELLPLALASGGLFVGVVRHRTAYAIRRFRRRRNPVR